MIFKIILYKMISSIDKKEGEELSKSDSKGNLTLAKRLELMAKSGELKSKEGGSVKSEGYDEDYIRKSEAIAAERRREKTQEVRSRIMDVGQKNNSNNLLIKEGEKYESFGQKCIIKCGFRPYVHSMKDGTIIFEEEVNGSDKEEVIDISKDGRGQKSLGWNEYYKFFNYLNNDSKNFLEKTKKLLGVSKHPNYLFVKYVKLKKNLSVLEMNEEMAKTLLDVLTQKDISENILKGKMEMAKEMLANELQDRIDDSLKSMKLKGNY
ncbi:MAG TPA: hypothetical protein PLZ62_02810 [bacterium]|nr:hypothetical protein [bacterium]